MDIKAYRNTGRLFACPYVSVADSVITREKVTLKKARTLKQPHTHSLGDCFPWENVYIFVQNLELITDRQTDRPTGQGAFFVDILIPHQHRISHHKRVPPSTLTAV